MPTVLGQHIFYHIPHTGGSFIQEGAPLFSKHEYIQPDDLVHASPQEFGIPGGLYSFTIVRHPLTWFKSNYSYRINNGDWAEFAHTKADNFDDHMLKVYEWTPNYLTKQYKRFMSVKDVCKFENYEEDLRRVFKDEVYDIGSFWGRKKVNTSNSGSIRSSKETEKLILSQEAWIMENLYA